MPLSPTSNMKFLFRKLISVAGLGLALLGSAAAQTQINLAGPQVKGVLPAARGGTGDSSITGITKGNGTSPFTAAVGSDVISLWTGTCSSSTFLRGDGSCQAPAGAGTVIGATFSGGIISVTGTTTLAFTVAGTSGGIPFFNSATGWASSGVLGAGQFVLGGGVGTTPTTSFSVVPVGNGGTGASSLTGLVKGNGTSPFTAAASSDVIALWTGSCSATTFLRGDGSCQTVSGSGNTTSATGTVNFVTKYTAANTIGNSLASDSGTVLLYTGSGGITANSGGSSSILTLGDSGINCPTTITSGTSGVCSAAFAPLWITNNSGTPATTTIETQNNKGASNGYASLDGTSNVPAVQLLNFPGAVFALTGNTSLSINSTATTWTAADYGASPMQPIVYTDNATSSTDISPDLYVNSGSASFHRPVEFALRGVDQFQICEQSGPQGQSVFGSAVTCANINNSPFAKIIMESQTAAHTIVRLWQASTSASGDEIEVNNATAQGTGWYFARGYSGVTSTDTSNGGGVESFHIRGDGQFQANTTSSVSQYAVWKNTTAALVGASQSSPNLALCGTEWHSAASVEGCLNLQFVPGTGLDAANTINFTHTGSATGVTTLQSPGPVASASDGTHAAYLSLLGNTTAPAITANTVGFLGPNSASFTAYALQLPSTNPSSGTPVLSCTTPSSSVSACSWVAAGGSSALSAITAASGANTIASGNNGAQVWNWAQTTNSQVAFTFGETSAATGTSDQELLVQTVAGSTAIPLTVQNSLTGSQTLAALRITPTWNTSGVVDAALLINPTNTGSGAASLLIDAQLGGTSQWNVDKAGDSTQLGSALFGASPPAFTAGTGGAIGFGEGTVATTLTGADILSAVSSNHRFEMLLNGGSALILVGVASAGTSGHCVDFATNGIDLADSGSACGSGSNAFPITITGGVSGGIPYFSSTTVESASAILTSTDVVLGGGAGAAPNVSNNLTFVSPTLTVGTAGSTTGILLLASVTATGSVSLTPASAASAFTLTLPAVTDTVAAIAATQTLTNKSISLQQIKSASGAIATLANGNNPLTISCAQTTASQACTTFTEATASTQATDAELQITTLTTSAAADLQLTQGAAGPAAANAPAIINITAAAAGGAASASINGLTGAPINLLTGAGSAGGATTGNGGTGGAFNVTLGAGGAHGGTTTNTGGVGGAYSFTPGAGTQGAATGAGGAAGVTTFAAAVGGAGGATSGTGGAGSDFLVNTGTGGAATSGSTTGRGGNVVFTLASAGGTGTAGAPGQFEIVGGTVAGANTTPFLNITGTWNTSGVVDAAIFANITNTGSGALSKLIDLQIGSTSQFNVDKSGNETLLGTLAIGTSPPACTAGTGGAVCLTAGTAFTNVAGTSGIYADSTINEFVGKTNGASGGGVMVRTQPGSIRSTGLVAAVTTATLCASSAGACNTAGTYHVHIALYQSGAACTTNTTGGVSPTLTWTDGNGTAHTTVAFPMDTQSSAVAISTTMLFNQTAAGIGTVFGSGDLNIDTNGSIIQYAIGFAQCSVSGTATYAASLTVDRIQ